MNPDPPKPSANPKKRRLSFQEYSRCDWGHPVRVADDGGVYPSAGNHREMLEIGCLQRIAFSLERISAIASRANDALKELSGTLAEVRKLLDPEHQKELALSRAESEKSARETSSRNRAAAAYAGRRREDGPVPIPPRELSVRAGKALRKNGIETLEELEAISAADIMRWKYFGLTSLTEIRQFLARHGTALRGEDAADWGE